MAAFLGSVGAGLGILCHTVAAALGLSLVIQVSPLAFWAVKVVAGLYLLWLGYQALTARNLISFAPSAQLPLRKVFFTGWLSNVLNIGAGLTFVAAGLSVLALKQKS